MLSRLRRLTDRTRKAARMLSQGRHRALATQARDLARKTALDTVIGFRGYQTLSLAGLEARFDGSDHFTRWSTRWHLRAEAPAIRQLFRWLHHGDTFADVGAHVGLFSVFATRKNPRGEVHAFEPWPGNAATLQRNAAMNDAPVTVHRLALSDRTTTRTLHQPKPEPGSALARMEHCPSSGGVSVPVQAARLDHLVGEGAVPPPDVVKVDVEGHERQALEGMHRQLGPGGVKVLLVELHFPTGAGPRPDPEKHPATTFLRERGYRVREVLHHRPSSPFCVFTHREPQTSSTSTRVGWSHA